MTIGFSPDGKYLASSSLDRTVKLWDGESGATLQTVTGYSNPQSITFSSDSKRLAWASAKAVILWDIESGLAPQMLRGHSDSVLCVMFLPDVAQLASCSQDDIVRLWDSMSGAVLETFETHSRDVKAVAFSPDGKKLVSGDSINSVRFWNSISEASSRTLDSLYVYEDNVKRIAFSPDSKWIASASSSPEIILFSTNLEEISRRPQGHDDDVIDVLFSPDSKRLVSCSWDRTIRLWDCESGSALQTLKGHIREIGTIAISPDGKVLASGSDDCTVRLWRTESGAELQTLTGHHGTIGTLKFSPDGQQLASGSRDRTIKLWDIETETVMALQNVKGFIGDTKAIALSPNSKQLAYCADDNIGIILRDSQPGAALRILAGHSMPVQTIAFSSDGKWLASSSRDKTVRLWDTSSAESLQTFETNIVIKQISFSIDDSYIDTDRGIIKLGGALRSATSVQQKPCELFVSDQWIAFGPQNLLWLPAAYRATCVATENQSVALGHRYGRVSVFGFDVALLERYLDVSPPSL